MQLSAIFSYLRRRLKRVAHQSMMKGTCRLGEHPTSSGTLALTLPPHDKHLIRSPVSENIFWFDRCLRFLHVTVRNEKLFSSDSDLSGVLEQFLLEFMRNVILNQDIFAV